MKKLRSLVVMSLLVVVLSLCLTACGSSSVEGTWVPEKIVANGIEMEISEMEALAGQELDIMFTFKSDKTMTTSSFGIKSEGTWKQDGDSVVIEQDGIEVVAQLKDGQLIVEMEGNELIFKKK